MCFLHNVSFWRVLMNVILGHEQSVCLSASRLTSYACLEGFDDLLLMTIFLTIHELRCKDNENYLWVYRFLLFFAHFSKFFSISCALTPYFPLIFIHTPYYIYTLLMLCANLGGGRVFLISDFLLNGHHLIPFC